MAVADSTVKLPPVVGVGVVGVGAGVGAGAAVALVRAADHSPLEAPLVESEQLHKPLALDWRAPPGINGPVQVQLLVSERVKNDEMPYTLDNDSEPLPCSGSSIVMVLPEIENSRTPLASPVNVPRQVPLNCALVADGGVDVVVPQLSVRTLPWL
jgi:hypothetical protein